MRTVDPNLWYKRYKKPSLLAVRLGAFGQRPAKTIEVCLRKGFLDATRELWNNCSVKGLHTIHDPNNGSAEKYAQIALVLMVFMAGVTLISFYFKGFLSIPPTIVTQLSTEDSIEHMEFPAIALCSNSIISKRQLKNFTQTLMNKTGVRYDDSSLQQLRLGFGALLTIVLPKLNPSLVRSLNDAFPNLNISDLMFSFSMPCSSMLAKCSWRGQVVACDQLFASRITPLGFCCVFNSRYQVEDRNTNPKFLDMEGQDFGLGVVVKEDQEDFAYNRRLIYGMEMLMFDGSQFPLMEDGSVRLYPLPRNSSLFIAVSARVQHIQADALQYSDEMRGCRSRSADWRGFSWCLAQCRSRAIRALCGCVPFTLQPAEDRAGQLLCGLRHLACLHKHREKLIYLKPWDELAPQLGEERQDGLPCEHCAFDCDRITYRASLSYSHYVTKPYILQNYLSAGISLVNASVIRIFYNTEHQERLAVEANLQVSELISHLCCIWVLVSGCSWVGGAELVFHYTVRWLQHCRRRYRIATLQGLQNV